MKKVTDDEKQPLLDNQHETFLFGAPFSCYKYGDTWNEETSTVMINTTALQSPVWDEGLNKWTLICLCELGFTDTPMTDIKADIEAIEEGNRSDLELILLERMAGLSEEHLALSVVAYADDVLTAPFFDIVDV